MEEGSLMPGYFELLSTADLDSVAGIAPTVGAFLPLLLAAAVMPFVGRKSE